MAESRGQEAELITKGRAGLDCRGASRLASTLALTALIGLGCASSSKSADTSAPVPQTVTAAAPTPEASAPAPQSSPAPRSPQPPRTVVIDPGGDDGARKSGLAAAAEAERRRRQASPPPIAAIDDENLASHAEGAMLSYSEGGPVSPPDSAEVAKTAVSEGPVRDEAWWRRHVRDLRLDWREAEEEIQELERRVSELRFRFYSEDDPYHRDGQIKPSWDQALEALERARSASKRAQRRLDEALEEGTREGALPGWLREGMELEPERRATERAPTEGDPGELVITEPNAEEDDWR